MKIGGENFKVEEYFGVNSSIPDCFVYGPNKIGSGHGEAKFYISNKDEMHSFYGEEGFEVEVIMLKTDIIEYMLSIKNEYLNPSFSYGEQYNKNRKNPTFLTELWGKRYNKILSLPEILSFRIKDQNQIEGIRGYVNSEDEYYKLIREIALPESSFISACKLKTAKGNYVYYWKLFVDFIRLENANYIPLSLSYGKGLNNSKNKLKEDTEKLNKEKERQNSRTGQGKYREDLLDEMPFCPITGITDERLLIASHIKPWACSNEIEKIDHFNGYMLTPMFDRLFDRGFITFTPDQKIHLSKQLSPNTYKKIGISEGQYFQNLKVNKERLPYLDYHRKNVFLDFARFID